MTKVLNRVNPDAVTEEDSDTALYCAWQNDHIATMGVLAEVADVSLEMRQVFQFLSLDSTFFKCQIQDEQDVGVGGEGAGEDVAEGGDQQAGQVDQQTRQAGKRC